MGGAVVREAGGDLDPVEDLPLEDALLRGGRGGKPAAALAWPRPRR